MRIASSVCHTLLLALALGRGDAQNPPAPTAVNDKCKVTGTVLAAATGALLAKAQVSLHPIKSAAANTYETLTGADGRFSLDQIEPGQYTLSANRDGFVFQQYNSNGSRRQAQVLDLQPGQAMTDLKLKLIAQGVIVGRVLDSDGEPLPNVQLRVERTRYNQNGKQLLPAGFASTNDLGEFRLFHLAPGRYYLSASRPATSMMGGHVIHEGPSRDYGATYYPGSMDVATAAAIPVAAGETVRGIDVTLVPTRAYHVLGHVKVSGAVSHQPVIVGLAHGSGGSFTFDHMAQSQSADGSFEINGVTPGDYILSARLMSSGADAGVASLPVTVGNQDVENIDLDLVPAPSISGQIDAPESGACASPNFQVSLSPTDAAGPFGGWASSIVDSNGEFVLKNLSLLRYTISFGSVPSGCYVGSIRLGEEEVTDGKLDFSQGVPGGKLEIALKANAPKVEGHVTDTDGAPAPGARVVLIPDGEPRYWSLLRPTASTDQNGHYAIDGIIPGAYTLYAFEDIPYGAWNEPDVLKPFTAKAAAIKVKEGDQVSQDLTAVPASATQDLE